MRGSGQNHLPHEQHFFFFDPLPDAMPPMWSTRTRDLMAQSRRHTWSDSGEQRWVVSRERFSLAVA